MGFKIPLTRPNDTINSNPQKASLRSAFWARLLPASMNEFNMTLETDKLRQLDVIKRPHAPYIFLKEYT